MKKKTIDEEIQELKTKATSFIALKEIFKASMASIKLTTEIAEGTLNVLHNYLNSAKNENKNEYAYIYIANKNDIQKFPEEISDRKGDYYIGDFVFNDECGFTQYKIHKDEYHYSCEYKGYLKGSEVILDISLKDIPESIYVDLVDNFINTGNEIVVLLREENIIRCIYSKSMIARTSFERNCEEYLFSIRPLISKFAPYLKPVPLKVVREIQ